MTFDGRREGTTDEWIFRSELKRAQLTFARIRALRLIAYVPDRSKLGAMGMFLIPIMGKMNATALTTNLGLEGVGKLIVRVRCVFRNVQGPRRGFVA